MGLARITSTLLCSVALTAGVLAAPADADVVDPTPLDPAIGVLPAAPVAYRPYTGPVCTDGDPACIEGVITEMESRLSGLAASCDHDSIFSLAYLRVTENVKQAADTGYFHDRTWLTQIDAVFAQTYFETIDAWNAGRTGEVPKAWQIALAASDDRSMTGLGDFMLNMNAHINNDFPHALATVGLTAADGTTHKPDHNAYNQRLDSLYGPVFKEEAERFDPTFDDIDAGPLEETGAGVIMRGWRELVWRHAENLATAKTPLQKQLAEHAIEEYAAGQAAMIKQLFRTTDGSAARDAWCADHG
ncbi:MAG: hypothetical protein JWR85_1542 [Marmoricola sp.]|nr:hypothetical protein [Marmoricola sp.]